MGKFGSGHRRGRGKPSPVDMYVSARVRLRRRMIEMSQTSLGEAIGLSFQQVQKYEKGTNRIGSSRLFDLSRALDVPVEFFFEEIPADVVASLPGQGRYELDPMGKQETLGLVRAYYKISNPQVRKRLFEVVKVIGAAFENQDE